MEIELKFLVMTPPENYESFPCHEIEQAYLCTEPVIRVRKEDDTCYPHLQIQRTSRQRGI